MKVVAFNGSPRREGNTNRALEIVLEPIREAGIETELVQMGSERIAPCVGCGRCRANKNMKCVNDTDALNVWVSKCAQADGIVIGSPVYFAGITSQTKAFIDRVGYVCKSNGDVLARKVGAAVAVNRRAGALASTHQIADLFLISNMVAVGSSYWNLAFGLAPGDLDKDEEGVRTMRNLGSNVAWAVERLSK